MTTQEALEWLIARKEHYELDDNCQELTEALDMAIKSLSHDKSVLEDIKAEIYREAIISEKTEYSVMQVGLKKALKIIDKYMDGEQGENT